MLPYVDSKLLRARHPRSIIDFRNRTQFAMIYTTLDKKFN